MAYIKKFFLQESYPLKKEFINVSLVFLSKPENRVKIVEPLGIESIAGHIERTFRNKVFVSGTISHAHNNIDEVIQKVMEEKPDILGLSVFFDVLINSVNSLLYLSKLALTSL